MANPTSRWDFVPVWGVYLNPVTNAASGGKVSFALASRITRVDGRVIYPDGASVVVQIGVQAEQDGEIRSIVRAAWRAADEATAGVAWDAVAWDTWWDTVIVPAAIFTRFPAADDPDIVQTDWSVTVREQLTSAGGKQYAIQPLLAHLDLPIPGINLGLIEVPDSALGVPAPMYAKAVPGGVASLDSAGKVPLEQLPDDIGGGGEPGLSAEEAVAAVASSLVEGDGVTITYDDEAGTISITADTPSPGVASTTSQGVVELATIAEANSDDETRAVTPAGLKAAINALVNSAPGTLDTLAELAAALGDDANFAASVTTALAGKATTAQGALADSAVQPAAMTAAVSAAVASLPIICIWTGTDWATLAGGPVPTSSALVRDYRSVGHDTEDVTAPTYYSTLDTWLQQPAGA